MSWITVGVMAASAVSSMMSNQRKAEKQRQNNLAQAEITKYSPWTGMKGQLDNSYTPGSLESGISGGIQGAAIGQGLKNSGLGLSQTSTPSSGGSAGGGGYLGFDSSGLGSGSSAIENQYANSLYPNKKYTVGRL